ncbi:hypothetical protein N7528_003680 [Penicillium herquei]|nr:hypothetical protein N7528_003680 [Penicillium herquei]
MDQKQFLAFRCLWKDPTPIKGNDFFPMENNIRDKAYAINKESEELKAFISKIKDNTSPLDSSDRSLGRFQLVADAWNEIPRDPTKINERRNTSAESEPVRLRGSERIRRQAMSSEETTALALERQISGTHSPSTAGTSGPSAISAAAGSDWTAKTKDEQEVNDALLLFLKALTVSIPGVSMKWNSFRSPLDKVIFGENEMTARVDGFLGAKDPHIPDIFAVAEVQSQVRHPDSRPQVFWQEAAEIVALICHDQKPENSVRKRPSDIKRYQHGFVKTVLSPLQVDKHKLIGLSQILVDIARLS